jgi:pimeloyl-ACP methyl ester carboxylesterase
VPEGSPTTGFAQVNGVDMYWESRGSGGTPLVVVHGGYGLTSMFAGLLDQLADRRRVVAIELQGHGHTRDIDRHFSFEAFGDDIAGLIDAIELGEADLVGYSLGAEATLRCAIQHPEKVRKLVLVSIPFRRGGWFPEVLAGFDQMSSAGFEWMQHSPMYRAWSEVAPDRDAFPALMDKTGDLLRLPYDWTEEVKGLTTPTLLVYADADSIPPSHAAEFFALLGGGVKDARVDGSGKTDMRLAILPGLTHYDVFYAPQLAVMVSDFIS